MDTLCIFTFYKFADFEHVLIHLSSSNNSISIEKSLPGEFSPLYRHFLRNNIQLKEINQNWGRMIVVTLK